ncbi:MAG TPA: hypothetical protein VF060_08690 [Trebonia sp.]
MVSGETAGDIQGSSAHAVPPGWPAPPEPVLARNSRGRGGAAAPAALVIALAGLVVAAIGLGTQLLPRQFTSAQQQQIMAWEVAGRWHDLPAGQVFPGTVGYAPPAALVGTGGPATLTANRLGIARQASCRSATDPAAAAVLTRNGCEAVLRTTYTDGTDAFVMTVGVVPFPSEAQATAAREELGAKRLRMSDGRTPGVRTVPVAGTSAAGFTNSRRQLSANIALGPYLVLYAVGYADGRPLVPVSADNYANAEMTSFAVGVAESAATTLGAPPALPHCPGAPGC